MTENRKHFPRIVALTAFVVYALTLSRGVTAGSLPLTASVAGWDWLPMASRPLTWLVTLPLHLLPAAWVPFALNLFSAAIAALTLGLLARCVELLPWDLAPDPKKPWVARLPALLAVAVCGFEFSFWQEATAATGEMTDIFLLTVTVWCLLEHRAGREMRWLNMAALAWGLGMTENWVMLVTLPLFVAALIALRGLLFFNKNFVLRMLLLGLAGFSVYALLPLVNWLNPHSPWRFGEAWLATLRSIKDILHLLYYNFWSWHRLPTIAILFYFLVPVLPCFVRMKDQGTGYLAAVDLFQIWIYRALRVVLLLACLWLAFDPEVGPREIMRQQLGGVLPMLTFDLVNALGIAFLTGSLLFAAQLPMQRRPPNLFNQFNSLLQRYAVVLFAGVSLAVGAGLLVRNLPAVLLANRQPLISYGELVLRSLPAGGGIVLGDDPIKLNVLSAALAARGEARHWQVANWPSLTSSKYRATLERQFPAGWLSYGNGQELNPVEMVRLLDVISRTNRIFFLEPHDGEILFEGFRPDPLGAISELKRYEDNRFSDPPLPVAQVAAGEKFWDDAWAGGLADYNETWKRPTRWTSFFKKHLTLVPVRHDQSQLLGRWYSEELNDWGVVLRQDGQTAAAAQRFEQALALNTNNVVAGMNLFCSTNLLAGKKLNLSGANQALQGFRSIQQIAQVIHAYGDFDDPGVRWYLGDVLVAAGFKFQAWLELDRARVLVPDAIELQLGLAEMYSHYRFDAEVFKIVNELRPQVTNSPAGEALDLELSMLEANSWMSQTNPIRANKILATLLETHPDSPVVTEAVFKVYVALHEAANALHMMDAQLARDPDNILALNYKSALLIQMNDAAAAIPVLDHALSLTNLPSLQLNHAFADLQLKNLTAAQSEFTALETAAVYPLNVHIGLAQTALARGDTNSAVQQFKICLSNAPPASLQWREVRARLDSLAR